ncbi:MAG: hypothetical protein V4638_11345 [Bacteroidota bacterium]
MKKYFFILPFLLGASAQAQSTLIEYNYHDDTYKYFKVSKKGTKKEVKRPFAYKGVPVQVVVKDMNPYQYNITYTYESFDEAPVQGMGGIETMLGGFTSFMGGLDGLGGSVAGNPIYNSLFGDDSMDDLGNERALGFSGAYSAELGKYKIEDRVEALVQMNQDLVKQSKEINNLFNQMLIVDYTNNELIKLLYDPEMKHSEMKQRANEYMAEVISDTTNLSISTIAAESKRKYDKVQAFMAQYNEFSSNSNNLNAMITNLETKAIDTDDKENLAEISRVVADRTREINENYTLFVEVKDSLSLLAIRDKLTKVFESYEMIKNADFDHEYSLKSVNDVTQLHLDFGVNDYDDLGTVKSRTIDIPTSGGFKMNTSAGLSMFSFLGGQNSYINNAGSIEAVKGDVVRPGVSSMLHFYRQSHRTFMLGGSVGISIPIEGDKDLNYMMGLSGIIGKKQRIIFNLGAMTGKIEKLSDGYANGDVLPSEYSSVPTKRAFQFGVFAGVTFNISSLFGQQESAPSSDGDSFGFGGGSARSTNTSNANSTNAGVTSVPERTNQVKNPYRPIIKPVPAK